MVLSHTIDVLLADPYRSYDYTGFKVWQFVRGLTAPTFLLTTGMVFVHLLRSTTAPLRHNPRLVKGIRRSLLLLAIGYLLHFPASSISGIFTVPPESWRTFWAVDVLQLIGIGLLLLLFGAWMSEKSGGKDYAVFGAGSLVFFVCTPAIERVNWNALLPAPIAAYCYTGSGSLFPLFPWIGYLMYGGMLGTDIAPGNHATDQLNLYRKMIFVAILLLTFYYGGLQLKVMLDMDYFLSWNLELVIQRLGTALLLAALIIRVSIKVRSVPPLLLSIGRRSLLIYVTHLVILYGSPWNYGINRFCDKCLSVWPTLSAALSMGMIMIGLAAALGKMTDGNR